MTASIDKQRKSNLEAWVETLAEVQMPIFAKTANEIGRIMGSGEFSSLELARVILQDPSMTAKVLKLSNSVFYNPGGSPISTISRGVLVLGFNAIQAICMSIAVVESLLKGKARNRVMTQMARSIHAATQARAMAKYCNESTSEEIFIVALLYRLGEMAFWCFAGEEGEFLDQAMRVPGAVPSDSERRVLGFQLSELTMALALEWKLSPLLKEALRANSVDPRVQFIRFGHEIAKSSEMGWQSSEMKGTVNKVSRFLDVSESEALSFLQLQADESVIAAKGLGAISVARLIPTTRESSIKESTHITTDAADYPTPDGSLQLRILREISTSLMQGANLNVLMEMVLEGIYRGVGMDRTVFALLTPDRKCIKAKYVLGENREVFQESFKFSIDGPSKNVFTHLLESKLPIFVESYNEGEWASYIDDDILDALQGAAFVAQTVLVGSQPIGLFYADRGPSERCIDSETFENFKLFVQQANMGLGMLARR